MIQWWQILLLTLYSAYQICDELTIVSSAGSPVFAGFITGLVLGDLGTGLVIGASLQLTVLGVGTFGGASRIDATSGAVLATAFSVAKGIDPEKTFVFQGPVVFAEQGQNESLVGSDDFHAVDKNERQYDKNRAADCKDDADRALSLHAERE